MDDTSRASSFVDRAARIAYAFVLLNSAAVSAAFAVVFRRKVWR